MKNQYKNYTDEQIIENSSKVFSLAGLLKSLGLKCAGGNYANMKRNLQRLNVDTRHWKGFAWNKHQQLKDWSNYTEGKNAKRHLIKLRGHCCESCNNTHWVGVIIKLELHHIDGDNTNNNLINLQLLCPNCHSFTDTWRKWGARDSNP